MDTYFRLLTWPLDEEKWQLIRDELAEMESLLDRFSPLSDISQINDEAGHWVNVNKITLAILGETKELARITDGSYDPTIGPLTELWRINSETEQGDDWSPPGEAEIQAKLDLIDYKKLMLSPDGQVKLGKTGMELDLGGIAKGFAVDRLVELLNQWQVEHALLDFGGDFYALGAHPQGRPWQLAIRHPRHGEREIGVLQVENQAITTSGDYHRYRIFQGERFSHILNPFTGHPPQELASVTIVAPRSTEADALSTAVFVLGKNKGIELVESLPGIEGVIIDQDLDIWVSKGLKDKFSYAH